jgi:hypothetical protein
MTNSSEQMVGISRVESKDDAARSGEPGTVPLVLLNA